MTVGEGADGYQMTYTGAPVAFGFKSITAEGTNRAYTAGEYADVVTNGTADYLVRYFVDDGDGKFDAGDAWYGYSRSSTLKAPTEVGSYWAVAMNAGATVAWGNANTDYDSADGLVGEAGVIAVAFDIVPRSIENAFVYEVNPDNAQDFSDTEFTYNGQAIELGVAIGTDKLEYGTDYTVSVKNVAGTQDGDNFKLTSGATGAGTYTVIITGKTGYFGDEQQQVTRTVTVNKLNLSEADVFAADMQKGASLEKCWYECVEINGTPLTALSALEQNVSLEQNGYVDTNGNIHGINDTYYQKIDANNSGYNAPSYSGSYRFDVTSRDSDNVEGSATLAINVVDTLVNKAYYGKDELVAYFANGNKPFFGDEWTYNASSIAMVDAAGAPFTNFTATLTNAAGEVVDAPTAAGKYTVTLQVNIPENYSVGGTVRADFVYYAGEIDGSTLEVLSTINGVNVPMGSTHTVQYTGEPVIPAITVKAGDATLTAGADYTVEYTTDEGEVVESMVDAGLYTVTVKLSDQYVFTSGSQRNYSFNVQIAPRNLEALTVVLPVGAEGLFYTGSAITPAISGMYTGADGVIRTITLDPSWYELHGLSMKSGEYYQPVESVVEAGDYMVNVVPTAACGNYTWGQDVYTVFFSVVETSYFTDVASDAWYADEVALAATLGYVNGVGETKLFMPDNDISRAELSQVLFNMAGQSVREGVAFPTGFSDVPELAWFAQPVSWAAEAGVVTGMGDTGAFAPYDNATREQVATMLYRYAKAQGMDVSGAADLSAYADGEAVSWWAAEAVAWAVDAGVFGQGTDVLRPSDPISRAEVAAMAVRLQPENVTTAADQA